MVILLIDKSISFTILRKQAYGYYIFALDFFNLGFIAVFLKLYPPFYRPLYGAKLFCVIIPTVMT